MEHIESIPIDDYTETPTLVATSSEYVYPVRSLLSGFIHPAADELPSNHLRSSNSNALDLSNPPTPKAGCREGQEAEVASGERRLVNDRSANRTRSSVNFSSDPSFTVNESDGSQLCLLSSTQQIKQGT